MVLVGKVCEEREMKVAATEAWKVYGSLHLTQLSVKALPHVFDKIETLQGDGGVGNVLRISFRPGMGGPVESFTEKFAVVDDEKRVKVVEVVEGGYLNLGFTLYHVTIEVIENKEKENECIARVTVNYELKEENAANVSLISIKHIVAIMQAAADYLHDNNDKTSD